MTHAGNRVIVIAGKNDIACNALRHLVSDLSYPRGLLKVVPSRTDTGRHTWQDSLAFTARSLGVEVMTLEQAYGLVDALFLSLEFDRIVDPAKFRTKSLYNFHFSALPAYRGSATTVWPIVNGESESGVTLHEIDAGVDSGGIVAQRRFPIGRDWTARDLYSKFLEESYVLFRENVGDLIAGTAQAHAQPVEGASYYARKELDYANISVNFNKTAWQVRNQVRGLSFWEYQLPCVAGRKILRTEILSRRSIRKPGTKVEESDSFAVYATADYDVRLEFSFYDELYAWAAGAAVGCPLPKIGAIDRQNANGWSAAMVAAYHNRADRLRMMLDAGADVNQANRRGTTLLMYAKSGAVNSGNLDSWNLCLERQADVDARDCNGLTVADYLRQEGRNDILATLPGGAT